MVTEYVILLLLFVTNPLPRAFHINDTGEQNPKRKKSGFDFLFIWIISEVLHLLVLLVVYFLPFLSLCSQI